MSSPALRHTIATNHYRDAGNVRRVQKALGRAELELVAEPCVMHEVQGKSEGTDARNLQEQKAGEVGVRPSGG